MSMMNNNRAIKPKRVTADEIARLIPECRGNISVVARRAGVDRATVYRRIAESPELQEALRDARERVIDEVESVLIERALKGNTAELIFFLKTQARHRGYIERREVSGPGGLPIQHEHTAGLTLTDFTPEELAILRQAWKRKLDQRRALSGPVVEGDVVEIVDDIDAG